jgi:predicted membrane-bound spermidine synthase
VRNALVGLAFLLSGAAALVYQVVWQRILALHSGLGIFSVALIVAAFMAGLGLGSHAGGVLSARVDPRRALRIFAALEVGVGVFAAVSVRFYHDWLYDHAAWLYQSTARMGLAHFFSLLLPTGLMGMSLPFLVRARVRNASGAPETIANLYGINVIGASLGALAAPWALIRFWGMEGAILAGVGGNLLAGVAALLAGAGEHDPPETATGHDGLPEAPGAPPLRLWMSLYALSGFCALSLEILWFRLVDVAVKSTAFTFGTVLSVYLLGLGAGSLLGARLAYRFARPLKSFLSIQCFLLIYAGVAVVLLAATPPGTPGYRWFFDYWVRSTFFQLGVDWNWAALARLYLFLPLVLYGPPTFLMGLSFTALQRAVQDDPRLSGRRVGLLQAANIAGCVAGSLLVGLVLLGAVGTTGSLRLLMIAGLAFVAVEARHYGWGRGPSLRAAGLLVLLALLPGQGALWRRLHGVAAPGEPAFIGEDATAVGAITPERPGYWRVSVNGLPHSWVPFEGIHTLLGAIPALIHPAPREVAVIGLGSGETAWAAACRRETRSVRVFEIFASQPQLLAGVEAATDAPELRSFLRDGRVRVEAADGRHALQRADTRYDLIQVDALYRTSAMSGNLYSVEFFTLCARRLKPGGVVCTQAPSRRALLTFAAALPYVLDLGNVMVGGNDPLPIDLPAWTERLHAPDVLAYFGPAVAEGILDRLSQARPAKGNPASRRGLNYDLFPRDEFSTPARTGP